MCASRDTLSFTVVKIPALDLVVGNLAEGAIVRHEHRARGWG
jgi:hypothetical protein